MIQLPIPIFAALVCLCVYVVFRDDIKRARKPKFKKFTVSDDSEFINAQMYLERCQDAFHN